MQPMPLHSHFSMQALYNAKAKTNPSIAREPVATFATAAFVVAAAGEPVEVELLLVVVAVLVGMVLEKVTLLVGMAIVLEVVFVVFMGVDVLLAV